MILVLTVSQAIPLAWQALAQPHVTVEPSSNWVWPNENCTVQNNSVGPLTLYGWDFTLRNDGYANGMATVAFPMNGILPNWEAGTPPQTQYFVPARGEVRERFLFVSPGCLPAVPTTDRPSLVSVVKI